MSFESSNSPPVIELTGVSKHYPIAQRPLQRMWQALRGQRTSGDTRPSYTALESCNLTVRRGEVIGVVGKNGAGKSTLLQLVTSTVQPSAGTVLVNGKISAILELGAGFNIEFTGRENILLAAATAGLDLKKQPALLEEIIEFSGIRPFIDQPIKTYSSGMQVRLAFSIATCTEPDILIIDEALSVGDGEFARKSFDRILALKNRGTTILFCSHSLFHIEAMCSRAIWLEKGCIVRDGHPSLVIPSYQDFLDGATEISTSPPSADSDTTLTDTTTPAVSVALQGYARLRSLSLTVRSANGLLRVHKVGEQAAMQSCSDSLMVRALFDSDPHMEAPSFAVTLHSMDGRIIGSAGAWIDKVSLQRATSGSGWVELEFPDVALLKGTYTLSAFLFCERGLHIYDNADHFVHIQVSQEGIEQGLFHVPRRWSSGADASRSLNP